MGFQGIFFNHASSFKRYHDGRMANLREHGDRPITKEVRLEMSRAEFNLVHLY